MKKYKVFVFVLMLIYIFSCCCFANATQDIFYYQYDDSVFEAARKESVDSADDIYMMKYMLSPRLNLEQHEIDGNKISIDYNHIFCEYDWTPIKALQFLKSKDKAAFLKTLPIRSYLFFVYYDNKLVTTDIPRFQPYKDNRYEPARDTYAINIDGFAASDYYHKYLGKNRLRQVIVDAGFEGYEPIYLIDLQGIWFSVVEKNETAYLFCLPSEYHSVQGYNKAIAPYQHLYDKQLLTVEKAEPLLMLLDDCFNGKLELPRDDGISGTGGGASPQQETTATGAEQVAPKTISKGEQPITDMEEVTPNNYTLLWVIAGTVVVIGAILTITLMKKKKT